MASLAHIEIEGEDYGTMLVEGDIRHGHEIAPAGSAYFCPSCARVWARVLVEGNRTIPWCVCCAACAAPWHVEQPGSVMKLWDRAFNEALPRKVLLREFELAVKEVA